MMGRGNQIFHDRGMVLNRNLDSGSHHVENSDDEIGREQFDQYQMGDVQQLTKQVTLSAEEEARLAEEEINAARIAREKAMVGISMKGSEFMQNSAAFGKFAQIEER